MLRELNADIWEPFSRAYAEGAAERYLRIHTPDFIRIEAGRRWIGGLDEYGSEVREAFTTLAGRGVTMAIGFRFVERIASDERASERGVFRLSLTTPDGMDLVRYGRFHTVARRTDAGWRLAVDYDDGDGEVGAAEFDAAFAVDDVGRFETSS